MTDEAPQLDPNRQQRAREYARLRRRLWGFELLLGAAYLLVWVATGWHVGLREAVSSSPLWSHSPIGQPWWAELLVVTLGFGLPWVLLTSPLSLYSGYVLPHRYELSTQTLPEWVLDGVKGLALSGALGAPLLTALYYILRQAPDTWWLWAAILYTAFGAVLTALAPILIAPLFFKLEPLGEEHAELRRRLIELARAAHTQIAGIYKIDLSRRTKAANAALVGLGRTRRIVLGDTLLSNFEPAEVETVLAHELAHHVHRDIPLMLTAEAAANFVTFFLISLALRALAPRLGLNGIADPAGLPVLATASGLIALLVMPFANAFSRWREGLADEYAIRATHMPEAFASALTRLADQNLADADPERWVVYLFHSHPPLRERIARAQSQVLPGPASA